MIDIGKKIIDKWISDGVDMTNIDIIGEYKVDPKGLLLLDDTFLRILFTIKIEDNVRINKNTDELWNSIVKSSLNIECLAGRLRFRGGLPKSRLDGFGVFTHADCYVEFVIEIDEEKVTDELLEQMTKPDFITKDCDKPVDKILKTNKKNKNKVKEVDDGKNSD